VTGREADLFEGGSIGPELVGGDLGGGKAVLFEQLTHQLEGHCLVAPTLYEHLQHFAFIIDGPPQTHQLATDAHDPLSQMPARCQRGLGFGRRRRRLLEITGPNFTTQRRTVS